MEDITDADYKYQKRVSKNFKVKNFDEYHNLYVQSCTLLLFDVFDWQLWNMCLKYMK